MWWVAVAGVLLGAAVWGFSVPLTGMREPFDSDGVYYPAAMFLAGVLATLPSPRHWWLAVLAVFLGERVYAFVMLPETRAWLLYGILVSSLELTWLPAAVGAFFAYATKRVLARRSTGTREPLVQ